MKSAIEKRTYLIAGMVVVIISVIFIGGRIFQKGQVTFVNQANLNFTKNTQQNAELKVENENSNSIISNANVNSAANQQLNSNTTTNTSTGMNANVGTAVQPEISRGDTTKQQVIFTFDAGSGIQSAEQVLDILRARKLTGTFFLTGSWASKNPDLVKRMSNEGHDIYNHTFSHPHLMQITDEEIRKEFSETESILLSLTGKSSKPYFRPPYGERNANVLAVAASEGYRSVYWTVDALDWKESTGTTADDVRGRILDGLSPGAIYLMHLGDTLTGIVLDSVFDEIEERGYSIVSLDASI